MRRKLWWSRLLAVLFVLSVVGVLPALANEPPPGPTYIPGGYAPRGLGTTYLALGDSLATGTEALLNNDNLPGYPDTLYQYLRTISPSLTYKNLGRDSETSTTMISGTATLTSQLVLAEQFIASERAAGRKVGLVTLNIGGNDLVNVLLNPLSNPELVLTNYRRNLTTIVDRLLAALTVGTVREGDLLLIDYYNPYPGLKQRFPVVPDPDVYVPRLNSIIKEIAAERALPVGEVFAAFAGKEATYLYVQRDPATGTYYDIGDPSSELTKQRFDYHPRPVGQRVIADAFIAVSGYRLAVYLPLVVKNE